MNTTRKAWNTPQVFVLGIEGTQAGSEPSETEEIVSRLVCDLDGSNCQVETIMRFPDGVSP